MPEIKGIQRSIDNMKKRSALFSARDPKLYRQTSKVVDESTFKNFTKSGRKPKWKKRKRKYSHPILLDTLELARSVEESIFKWIHRGFLHVMNITGPPYGRLHQYGHRNLPARPFVKILQFERQRILKIFQKAFRKP